MGVWAPHMILVAPYAASVPHVTHYVRSHVTTVPHVTHYARSHVTHWAGVPCPMPCSVLRLLMWWREWKVVPYGVAVGGTGPEGW
eukprot:2331805-Rhodomonas_salina.2